jgi:hypothetical protein
VKALRRVDVKKAVSELGVVPRASERPGQERRGIFRRR